MTEKELHKKQMTIGIIAIVILGLIYFIPNNSTRKINKGSTQKVDQKQADQMILNAISESIASSTANGNLYAPANVMYSNNGFVPSLMQIYAGQKIIFTNTTGRSGMQIVVDSMPAVAKDNNPLFGQSKPIGKGETYEYIFTTEGTYDYYSKSNGGAHAKIIVVKPKY